MRRAEESVWVEATCACGAFFSIPLSEARARASVAHCLCAHYREAPPWADEIYKQYLRIVFGRDPEAQWEQAWTDRGWEGLPPVILDRLKSEGKVRWWACPARNRSPKPGGPDRSWATFEGFIEAVGWPTHPGQRLVKRSKHSPWTADNVVWCFAERVVFSVAVPPELIAQAQRRGWQLVQRWRWGWDGWGKCYRQAYVAAVKTYFREGA
jgi:hypothetical protein